MHQPGRPEPSGFSECFCCMDTQKPGTGICPHPPLETTSGSFLKDLPRERSLWLAMRVLQREEA